MAFVFALKRAVREHLRELGAEGELWPELVVLDESLDALASAAFDLYGRCRESVFQIRVGELRRSGAALLKQLDGPGRESGSTTTAGEGDGRREGASHEGLSALIVAAVLVGIVWIGAGVVGQTYLFGVVIPYAAIAVFLAGVVYRVLRWASAPVPYRITTTCGQQTVPALDRGRAASRARPTRKWTAARMALEILFFRSLFRNTKVSLTPSRNVTHDSDQAPLGSAPWSSTTASWSSSCGTCASSSSRFPPSTGLLERLDGFFQVACPRSSSATCSSWPRSSTCWDAVS